MAFADVTMVDKSYIDEANLENDLINLCADVNYD